MFGSLTNSSYEPYGFASDGAPTSFRNCVARARPEELAAATMVCLIEVTPRVFGSTSRSFEKVCAMPPVARMPQRMTLGSDMMLERETGRRCSGTCFSQPGAYKYTDPAAATGMVSGDDIVYR